MSKPLLVFLVRQSAWQDFTTPQKLSNREAQLCALARYRVNALSRNKTTALC